MSKFLKNLCQCGKKTVKAVEYTDGEAAFFCELCLNEESHKFSPNGLKNDLCDLAKRNLIQSADVHAKRPKTR